MEKFVSYNGKFFTEESGLMISADHSYRYGDGLFETMKIINGKISCRQQHFERLFQGIKILKFTVPIFFTEQNTGDEIIQLCKKNNCERSARVRLSVSRGSGGLYDCDNNFSYLIECWPLDHRGLNENGLIIDVYPEARKAIDAFSNLKSANYLPYIMAAVWAKENKLNDALILNSHDRICDATIANIFWVKDEKIFTPPVSEGCVAGVMRGKILKLGNWEIGKLGCPMEEISLTENMLLDADEVFLTNVTTGLRWVKQFRDKTYTNRIASKVFAAINQTIWC